MENVLVQSVLSNHSPEPALGLDTGPEIFLTRTDQSQDMKTHVEFAARRFRTHESTYNIGTRLFFGLTRLAVNPFLNRIFLL